MVCSTSNKIKDQVTRLIETREIPIHVTPFGIDTKIFRSRSIIKKKESEEIVIGTFKWIAHRNSVDTLLKGYALFVEKNLDLNTRLLLVGDGGDNLALKSMAKKLGIWEKCEFYGFIPHNQIPEVLNTFNVYITLSRYKALV